MCRNRHTAQPLHVLDDVTDLAAERKRRLRQAEGNDMAVVGADLDRVDAKHAAAIDRRIGTARRVSVIREDHELQPGPLRRRGDVFDGAGAVRTTRVHVDCTAHRTGVSASSNRQDDGRIGHQHVPRRAARDESRKREPSLHARG